jgi:drug/metabolite transporter (DMT)-like permease
VSFREQLAAAVVLLPFVIARHDALDAKSLCAIGAIGVLCTATAFSLFVSAQKRVSAQTAGISAGMETVYGIVFAAVFLREMPTVRDILGGALILTAAVVSSLSAQKHDT